LAGVRIKNVSFCQRKDDRTDVGSMRSLCILPITQSTELETLNSICQLCAAIVLPMHLNRALIMVMRCWILAIDSWKLLARLTLRLAIFLP